MCALQLTLQVLQEYIIHSIRTLYNKRIVKKIKKKLENSFVASIT